MGRRVASTGFTREGKTPVFLRGRDASSAESFSRSLQGRALAEPRAIGFAAFPERPFSLERGCAAYKAS